MSLSSSTVGAKIKYKMVILGDPQVGKTSIIDRFINDRFETSYNVLLKVG
jgi:GTPase SAR1 family protein